MTKTKKKGIKRRAQRSNARGGLPTHESSVSIRKIQNGFLVEQWGEKSVSTFAASFPGAVIAARKLLKVR